MCLTLHEIDNLSPTVVRHFYVLIVNSMKEDKLLTHLLHHLVQSVLLIIMCVQCVSLYCVQCISLN